MKILAKDVRMSFNDLYQAKAVNDGDPKFSITAICSDATKLKVTNADGEKVLLDHSKMKNLIDKVLIEKLGKVPAKFKNWAYCKADGSYGAREEYTDKNGDWWGGFDENTFYISASKRGDKAPNGIQVIDQGRETIEANSGKLFSGCYVNLILDLYAIESKTGVSVQFSLEAVQLLRKGEPLGISQVDAKNEFDEEEADEVTTEDFM
ncbi:DUF2815 family protein [Akkermansiaceae bacterium]|nr:DUF2815 family protein [Akkermansiaceae bacterium]